MTDTLRVILEIGKKRRVVAGAMDWPGLDRWGTSEDDAIAKLLSYVPRYAGVAERAGMAARVRAGARRRGRGARPRIELDRLLGHRPRAVADRARGAVSRPTWSGGSTSCAPAGPTSTTSPRTRPAELRPGRAAAGARRDQIIRHVYAQRARAVVAQGRGPDAARGRPHAGGPGGASRRRTSTRSAPTTPRASRRGPGRSSSSSAAPPTTSWITRGRWRTGTPARRCVAPRS